MFGWLLSAPVAVVRWIFAPIPFTVLSICTVGLYLYCRRNFDFWRSRGVRGPSATVPFGNEWGPPFWKPMVDFENWIYYKQGGKKYCGYFQFDRPVLFVGDPDLIRAITIKDFECFANRRDRGTMEGFEEALSIINGPQWKATRAVMSPTFSASKLKAMHQITLDNASNLIKYVQSEMKKNGEVEMKDCFGRFTMDNIASCAFGVNCNSYTDPNGAFVSNAAKLFAPGTLGLIYTIANLVFPQFVMSKVPNPARKMVKFFSDVVDKTIAHRERNPGSTNDFLQLLLDTKDQDGKRVLSNQSIVSQSILFFFAGYDTTATLLTFAAYNMARYPEYQQLAQEDIDAALQRYNGQLTYDAVMEMTYVDRVLSETLRLYPPATRLERESTKDYTLPGTNVHLPRGTVVEMPVFVLHRDPDHYPDPLKFDPDRFLPEQKEQRHPCAYLAFGSGPRNCIAMRFALFEAKVALVSMLKDMTLLPVTTTPPPPCPLDKKSFLTTPEGRRMFLKAGMRMTSQ